MLTSAGYQALIAANRDDLVMHIDAGVVDLVLLEMELPSCNGVDVCRRIRCFSDVPLIFVTRARQVEQCVAGLVCGADDYIVKPFDGYELLLRISAVLRRANAQPDNSSNLLTRGAVTLKLVTNEVVVGDGTVLTLTPIECRVLSYLMRNAGHILSREQIADAVWQGEMSAPGFHTVSVYINRLRHKLEVDLRQPRTIRTARDLGYVFVVAP